MRRPRFLRPIQRAYAAPRSRHAIKWGRGNCNETKTRRGSGRLCIRGCGLCDDDQSGRRPSSRNDLVQGQKWWLSDHYDPDYCFRHHGYYYCKRSIVLDGSSVRCGIAARDVRDGMQRVWQSVCPRPRWKVRGVHVASCHTDRTASTRSSIGRSPRSGSSARSCSSIRTARKSMPAPPASSIARPACRCRATRFSASLPSPSRSWRQRRLP